ncbi:hypothetical protein [Tenacibaculum haliotis]|uniref:hypothetical protein n=1 Tax=Tenacibaculum haliotis TaxID=1888914 RepID=UPI0021AE7CB7|nr:hypothetical protein [Tenacibaculum haliotis]MCT4698230.1 hypothetical protein [Tenacibaculum haliotis]
MGIKFGEIDANQILDNEFRLGVLERLLEGMLNANPNLKKPTADDLQNIRKQVVEELKKKYPNSGIEFKNG